MQTAQTYVDLTEVSSAVAKAVAMDKRGKTMLERVEPILSNLEALFAENPNIAQIYRDSEGTFHPGPAAVVTKAMVEGLRQDKFKQAVMVKLQHETSWKADPYLAMHVVVTEAKEWKKIEVYTQSFACLLYTSPSPRDATLSRMPSSA